MDYDKIIGVNARKIPPSGIRKFFDIAAEMKDCISLGVGEPDFVTPGPFREAAIKSINQGKTQYTSNSGLKELRMAVTCYLHESIGVDYDPINEVLITVGASEGIDIALRALLNPGDEVLVPMPSYVSYSPCVKLAGGVAVTIDTKAENKFKLTAEELTEKITPKTKALILPYPNNPTGAIMEREYLEKIAPIIIKHNLIVITDEIYSELTYGDQPHVSIASLPGMWERTILINGFSKSFAMTGWRVGYVAAPPELAAAMRKIHQYVIMCAPTAGQYAAVQALEHSFRNDYAEVKEMKKQYNERRIYLVNRLNDMGLDCFEPRGAFYAFPSVASTGMTGEHFAEKLLYSKRVAVVPGSAFGASGRDFIRISYAYSIDAIKTALDKIEEFLQEIK